MKRFITILEKPKTGAFILTLFSCMTGIILATIIILLGGCSAPTPVNQNAAIMPPVTKTITSSLLITHPTSTNAPVPLKTNVVFSWQTIYDLTNGVITGLVTSTNLLLPMRQWTVLCEFPAQHMNQWTNENYFLTI